MKRQSNDRKSQRWSISLGAAAVFAALILTPIAFLVWACRTYLDPPKDTEVGIPALVAYLAFVAIVIQIIVFVKQWEAMQETLRQNRELFELTERPSLGIDGIQFGQPRVDGQNNVIIGVRNSGKAPAKIIDIICSRAVQDRGDPKLPCPEPIADNVDGLVSQGILAISGLRLLNTHYCSPEQCIAIDNGTSLIFVWVKLTYKGISNREYILEYYARYNPHTKHFEECGAHNEAT